MITTIVSPVSAIENGQHSMANIVEKVCKYTDPLLEDRATFHVIGNDKLNPWEADSFKFTPSDIRFFSKIATIFATPHIGIHWPSNSMYQYMGVKICDFTGNQSVKDTDDKPEYLGIGGVLKNYAVQKDQVLSPYLRLNADLELPHSLKEYSGCNNLAFVHHHAKKKAIGSTNVVLDQEILSQHYVSRALELLEKNEAYILGEYDFASKLFNRFVDSSGIVLDANAHTCTHKYASFLQLKDGHWNMIHKDEVKSPTGYMPLKEVIIMMDALRCFVSSSQNDSQIGNTFLMSGISMIHYLKNPKARTVLQRMYEVLQREFDWLPLHMRMFVLPGGLFRFLPSSGEQELHTHVVELIHRHNDVCTIGKALAEVQNKEQLITERRQAKTCFIQSHEKFIKIFNKRRGFNQYDLLSGEFVHDEIPNLVMDYTFQEIKLMFNI